MEVVAEEVYARPPEYLFEPAAWPRRGPLAEAGRGNTVFVGDDTGDYALRHYRRGGAVARVLGDRYLAAGAARSRSLREWHLLRHMRAAGLPVPQPVAARYQRSGLWYRADLLTRVVPASRTLVERLCSGPLAEPEWAALGRVIQRFHAAGICHADLNAHNILCDAEGAWHLIDFDRGTRRPAGRWRDANLARLQRSLAKEAARVDGLHWRPSDWPALIAGYADESVVPGA